MANRLNKIRGDNEEYLEEKYEYVYGEVPPDRRPEKVRAEGVIGVILAVFLCIGALAGSIFYWQLEQDLLPDKVTTSQLRSQGSLVKMFTPLGKVSGVFGTLEDLINGRNPKVARHDNPMGKIDDIALIVVAGILVIVVFSAGKKKRR